MSPRHPGRTGVRGAPAILSEKFILSDESAAGLVNSENLCPIKFEADTSPIMPGDGRPNRGRGKPEIFSV